MLTKPDFTLREPNRYYAVPDTVWWLWLAFKQLEPSVKLGGIYADKPGFHNTGAANKARWPGNYSIRDKINQSGLGWTHASALDLTFPDAQRGDYKTINRYTRRLVDAALDDNDPRLDMILFEFYGQADTDREVEGYNEYREQFVTSDPSHLWHIHMSFIRSKVGDWWGMWALYTVLAGWTVEQWRRSLPADQMPPKPKPKKPAGLPEYALGARMLRYVPENMMRGTDVLFWQKWIGPKHAGPADGVFGPKTKAGVMWYQRMRGIRADGIIGPQTWAQVGVRMKK